MKNNETEKNYKAFQGELSKLLEKKENEGKFSIWSNQSLIDIFPTFDKAVKESN